MASPNFDTLVQKLSIPLDDYVASASSDGATYKKTDREVLLSYHAQSLLWNFFYVFLSRSQNIDNALIKARFDNFVASSSVMTTSGSQYALSGLTFQGEVVEILSAVRNTDNVRISPVSIGQLSALLSSTADNRPGLTNPICYLNGQTLVILPNSTENQSVSITISTLRTPSFSKIVADPAGDIEWGSTFYNDLIELAYAKALRDDGNFTAYDSILQRVFSQYYLTDKGIADPITKKALAE